MKIRADELGETILWEGEDYAQFRRERPNAVAMTVDGATVLGFWADTDEPVLCGKHVERCELSERTLPISSGKGEE